MGFEFELISNFANSFVNTATSSSGCCWWKQLIDVIITIMFLAIIRFAVKCFWVKKHCLPVLTFRRNPKSVYKQEAESPFCTVCLDEVSDGEKYRRLPECKHCFHVDCIDAWFQSRSTCPLCRNQVSAVVHHLHRRRNRPDEHGLLVSSLLGIVQSLASIMDKVPFSSESSNATFVMGTETGTSRYIL